MQQIVESVTNTCMKFAQAYTPWLAAGILGFVGIGIALRVLAGILPRGGPRQGK